MVVIQHSVHAPQPAIPNRVAQDGWWRMWAFGRLGRDLEFWSERDSFVFDTTRFYPWSS